MRVGLFVPCYVDQFYPDVAIATLELLNKQGCEVVYPTDQTCCSQPLANAGYESRGETAMHHFVKQFEGFDYIVSPSGSCVLHVQEHYGRLEQTDAVRRVRSHIFELCAFLTDVLNVGQLDSSFPHRVGVHASCHGLRGLRLAKSSELVAAPFDKVRGLLNLVGDIDLVDLNRSDECCGFGGTFAVTEEAVSARMGLDRLADHIENGAEYITGTDMSCLMHLEGLIRRRKLPVRVVHIAEILNGGAA